MKTFPVRGKRNRLVVNAPLDATACGVLCKLATPQSPQSSPLENLYFEFFPVVESLGGGEIVYLSARAGTENDIGQVPVMPEGVSSVVIQQRLGSNELLIEVHFSQADARALYGTPYDVRDPRMGDKGLPLIYGDVSAVDLGPHAIRIEDIPETGVLEEGLAQPYRLLINEVATGGEV